MLAISTIPEALAELEKLTGRAWTESEFFDVATRCSVELDAAAPITSEVTIETWVIGEGLKEKHRYPHGRMARLFPFHVGQLWINGETMTIHPSCHEEIEDEYRFLTEPVRVTRENVRIKDESLRKILAAWEKMQARKKMQDGTPVSINELRSLEAARGITKQEVLIAFGALVNIDLGKALGDGKGLFGGVEGGGARTQKGKRGKNDALWNPVDLAVGLNDKHFVPLYKLKEVFKSHPFLNAWSEEWEEKLVFMVE